MPKGLCPDQVQKLPSRGSSGLFLQGPLLLPLLSPEKGSHLLGVDHRRDPLPPAPQAREGNSGEFRNSGDTILISPLTRRALLLKAHHEMGAMGLGKRF